MASGGGGMNASWPQASHVTLTPTGSWAPSNPSHGVDPAQNDTPLVFNMSRAEPYVREGSGGRDKSVESGMEIKPFTQRPRDKRFLAN